MGCNSVGYINNKYANINECIIKNTINYLIPGKLIEKLSESILRIEFENKISTGFFMKMNFQEINRKFLLTCAHSIIKENIESKITISIFYGKAEQETEKKIELDNNKRFIKCFIDDDIDATIIEILPEDEIPENKYLYPDLNYQDGYEQYFKSNIYTAGYPNFNIYKGEKYFSAGEILGFRFINDNNYHFLHNCSTKAGSSGSPLININQQVVGIHYGCNIKRTVNHGVFIGSIIDILYKEEKVNIILNGKIDDEKINQSKIVKEDVNIYNNKEKIINDRNVKINNNEEKNRNVNRDRNDINIKKDETINDNINLNKNEPDIISIKNKTPKKKDNDFLIKVLSKGEDNNKNSKSLSNSDMAIINEVFNNPSFMKLMKTFSQDQKIFRKLNNMPEVQKLKESNPIFKEAFNNPDLMNKLGNPEILKIFSEIKSIINKDKEKNNNIDDPKIFEDKFNQLKNMGFNNDNLIREALLICKGNIEEAKEYLHSVEGQ